MPYTDQQNLTLSGLAYLDLADRYEYYAAGGVESVSLDMLLNESDWKKLHERCANGEDFDTWSEEVGSWLKTCSLAGAYDTNDENGFCAYIIETGESEAAVAFRGSDALSDPEQWIRDWTKGDAGLLLGTETAQHKAVRAFTEQYRDQLNGYRDLNATGHSLGGNLAEFFTIVSDEYGLDDNIQQCVSLDSPGFSKWFLLSHKDRIAQLNADHKLVHYQWSLVGGLLWPTSKDFRYVEVTGSVEENGPAHMFDKHHLWHTVLEGSSFVTTDQPPGDILSRYTGYEAKWLDLILSPVVKLILLFVLASSGTSWFFLNGILRERGDEHRAQRLAAQEAASYPEIYIDTAAYAELAGDSRTAADALKDIAGKLWDRSGGRPFTMPALGGLLLPITYMITSALNEIDELLDAAAYSARRAEECADAMEQIGSYLSETAKDFREAERTAQDLVQAWLDTFS